ncbi:protein of unknown function [Candidatus Promineifilum breve]|uniref:Uncharacterized protein n=1 Tax=Candidatus Promineifilum breve TaxID=1806508 RepID=A0A160T8E6_9CHLR|nr:protein of unknown function [Candidatus Promineifilum breve]
MDLLGGFGRQAAGFHERQQGVALLGFPQPGRIEPEAGQHARFDALIILGGEQFVAPFGQQAEEVGPLPAGAWVDHPIFAHAGAGFVLGAVGVCCMITSRARRTIGTPIIVLKWYEIKRQGTRSVLAAASPDN